ncbi:acyltransferase [Methylobacter sp. S3L5C]|uniref:acyltransferase family protein n=1 Tax=Methylobacter sp. S3L5C TaxID=2839024 RepID=UPI001FAE2436|nr:acyltransferase [Methylobacter sp. S3L5C]UOA08554.1 acyltransferase [Methylobacter sp. S3L5C]
MIIIPKASTKIDSLQAIRAFAAIAVMLFHGTQILHERLHYLFLNNLFIPGFSGVDVFFVLSGFIIFYTSSPEKSNVGIFLKKRFIRIYPIYWIVTILLIISFLFSPSSEQSYKSDLGIILGSFWLYPQKQYIVGVAWTLTYEVIFYLVFALTYLRKPIFLLYAFIGWITAILLFYFFNIKTNIFAIDVLTNPIILNFSFGCLVAFVYKRHSEITHSEWFFWGGLILFVLMWSIFYQLKSSNAEAFTDDMARVYLFGIPASLLIFGALYLPMAVPGLLVYLGDASYSLYLVHGTVLSILIKIVLKSNYGTLFANFSGAIILFISTLAISCCFYSLVEKNLLIYLNRVLVAPRTLKYPVQN